MCRGTRDLQLLAALAIFGVQKYNTWRVYLSGAPAPTVALTRAIKNMVRRLSEDGIVPLAEVSTIFLWLPDRTEDRSGLVAKIATCWAKIGSRVWKGGRNDGLDGFSRFNNILKKSSKTGFRDR